jgi:hypothetical protein
MKIKIYFNVGVATSPNRICKRSAAYLAARL